MTEEAGTDHGLVRGGEKRDLIRDAQGMRRVVRVHDDGEAPVPYEALEESQDD